MKGFEDILMDFNGLRDFKEFKGIVRKFRGFFFGILRHSKEFYGIFRNINGF